METIALHTSIAAGQEADHMREHRQICADLDPPPRRPGMRSSRYGREGRHLPEVEDYRVIPQLAEDPASQRWPERINQFLQVETAEVWSLPPGQPAATAALREGRA